MPFVAMTSRSRSGSRSAHPPGLPSQIVNIVVQAVMGSRAGVRIDRNRLRKVVEDRLPHLVDGARLRFEPVLRALLRVDGVTEADLYVGLVNLSVQLAQVGVELEPLELELSPERRLALLDEARLEAERGRGEAREAEVRSRIHRLEARKLGDLLVGEGLIDGAQLAAALEAQKKFGGRLGTNLVERGVLTENELAHFLSVQLGVPCLTRLDQIDPEARRAVSPEIARTYRVVPARVDGDEVHLAMADPLDLEAIDAVAAGGGRRVFPVVAPELLISYALERAYGIPRETRLVGVGHPASPRLEPLATHEGAPKPEDEDRFDDTLDLPGFSARLVAVETDAEILELVGCYVGQRSEASLVLRVDGSEARGWSARGAEVTLGRLRETRVDVEQDPLLSHLSMARGVVPLEGLAMRTWAKEGLGLHGGRLLGAALRRGVELIGFVLARVPHPRLERELDQRFVRMTTAAFTMVACRQRILDEAG